MEENFELKFLCFCLVYKNYENLSHNNMFEIAEISSFFDQLILVLEELCTLQTSYNLHFRQREIHGRMFYAYRVSCATSQFCYEVPQDIENCIPQKFPHNFFLYSLLYYGLLLTLILFFSILLSVFCRFFHALFIAL